MNNKLPDGWLLVTLRDIAVVIMGQAPPGAKCNHNGQGTPFVKAGEFREVRPIIREWTTMPLRMAEEIDILVCVVGATCGKLNLGIRAAIGRSVAAIRPLKPELQKVIYYQLIPRVLELRSSSTGSAQGVLQREQLLNLSFALPPLAEQRRIVARLKKLEARSRRARAALDTIPPLLAQTRQSLLAAAFRGDLTTNWRQNHAKGKSGSSIVAVLEAVHEQAGGHKLGNAAQASEGVHDLTPDDFPASWGLTDLRNLCPPGKPITYGILMPGPDRADGVPYIRVADFPGETINMETIRRTSKEMDAKFSRSRLSTGDLLLSIRGSVGRLTTIPSELNGANITQDSARLSISTNVETRFVEHMLRAPQTQTRMQLAVKGVAVRGINIGDVRALQMPIPPLSEQREIVRRLESALARLDVAAPAHTAAVAELDRLDQSLLAQAFSGKLVNQDPGDEPAEALLARIRATR